jgi:hypothetical protein
MRLVVLSDIHGTLESFLQPLIELDVIRIKRTAKCEHVAWKDTDARVVLAGDLVNRIRTRRNVTYGSGAELENEELLIFLHVHYLNLVHPHMSNPVEYVMGNHCYANLLGGKSEASAECKRSLDETYVLNVAMAARHFAAAILDDLPFDISGRKILFLMETYLEPFEKDEVARRVIEEHEWPKLPVTVRDYYWVRAAAVVQKFLVVHGGPISEFTDVHEWVNDLNNKAQQSVRNREPCPKVARALTDRRWAASSCPFDLPVSVIIGHSRVSRTVVRCTDQLRIGAEMSSSAADQCAPDEDCELMVRCIVIEEDQVRPVCLRPRRRVGHCRHNHRQSFCPECRFKPSFFPMLRKHDPHKSL